MSFEYVAQPYTAYLSNGSLNHELMEYRYLRALAEVSKMLTDNRMVYSPIVHCHEMAKIHTLPKDFSFWKNYNKAMLERASGIILLKLEGWQESEGLQDEWKFARETNMPVTFWDMEEL
jgi:hypothetical protein